MRDANGPQHARDIATAEPEAGDDHVVGQGDDLRRVRLVCRAIHRPAACPTALEGQRTRMLGELAGSIDLDEVLNRVLEAAGAIEGVDAALITVATPPGGEPIVATLGLSAEEAQRQAVLGPPDGREARAISMSYEYGALEADEEAIRSGVAVPLPGETAHLGLLTIFTRAAQPTFGESQVSELEQLALRAGPAIENARRFREARQLADLDALTGLHNRRYFHETLAREVARAHRYSRNLALIIFDLDDFKAINDRIGHLSGDGVLAEAGPRRRALGGHRVPRRRRRVRRHPSRVAAQGRGPALREAAHSVVVEACWTSGPSDDVGRGRRASAGRRRDRVLPASGPCALRREGGGQGPGGGREPRAAAAAGEHAADDCFRPAARRAADEPQYRRLGVRDLEVFAFTAAAR